MRVLGFIALLVAAAGSACSFDVRAENCAIRCGEGGLCPEEMTCGESGYCYAGDQEPQCTADDASVTDASPADGDIPDAHDGAADARVPDAHEDTADASVFDAGEVDAGECSGTETRPCNTGELGRCMVGTQTCDAGVYGPCESNVEASDVEVCDGLDDDCDDQIDEDYTVGSDSDNCGVCGKVCIAYNATPTCHMGECSHETCDTAYADLDENIPGCEYECPNPARPLETCNGIDDDCDGEIDELPIAGVGDDCYLSGVAGCEVGVGCTGDCAFGTTTCSLGHVVCEGYTLPTAELCDDHDNDCDGDVDEAAECSPEPGCLDGETQPCDTGEPGICAAGTQTCSGGVFGACEADFAPRTEVCNGVDDNCDDVIDNGVGAPVGDSCGASGTGCSPGTVECFDPDGNPSTVNSQLICVGAVPGGPETCNGVDDDCNGFIDDVPSATVASDEDNCGACGNTCVVLHATAECTDGVCGYSSCDDGFADHNLLIPGCEYECHVFPTTAETCNGLDDDCDGEIDNDAGC